MDVYMRIDINIVAMALLGAIIIIAFSGLDMRDNVNKAYIRVSIIIMVELMIETITCIINKQPYTWLIPITYFLHICLFSIAPVLSYFGYVFIKSIVYPNRKENKIWNIIIFIPVLINLLCAILSIPFDLIFYVTRNNVYHRGRCFILFSIITYFYILLMLITIIRRRKLISKKEFTPLLLLALFPTVGGLVQTIFYGPLLMWSSIAFGMVIVYVFLKERMIHLDILTGTWTRGSFEFYLCNRLKQIKSKKIGIIYCDLDELKEINDRFGHLEGDYAIKKSVEIIKKSLDKNDIITRMGGDEFIIMKEEASLKDLNDLLEQIMKDFNTYNDNSVKPYDINCSFGADIIDFNCYSMEEFLHHVDCLMYENKRNKKL